MSGAGNGQQYNGDDLSKDLERSSLNGGGSGSRFNPSNVQGFQPNFGSQSFVPGQFQQQQQAYAPYQQQQQPQQQQFQQFQPQQQQQQASYGQYGYNNAPYNNNYNQNYNNFNNNNKGNNNFNNFNGQQQSYQYQPQQQQSQQPQAMSLEDYQKQQKEKMASLNKPIKKSLKLDLSSSSGIKIGSGTSTAASTAKKVDSASVPASTSVSASASVNEKKEEQAPAKAESQPQQQQQQAQPAAEKKKESKETTTSSNKKDSSKTAASQAESAVSNADALVKEQEDEVDQEVVNDMFGGKDHLSIIFMGHVDAGKSTMGGNILYLTDAVDKRTVEKYEREAKDAGRQGWYLSWIMDTNKEERADGKTIEVGRAYFETEKRRYTILDAPGHKMYVSEMIGGASQADVGILVISARKGEYETGFEKGGQTREHALLAKTQGVNKLIVVVNKMDDATVQWSKERYDECTNKLAVFLKGVGYQKNEVIFMPVSGYTGAGLKDRVSKEECPWYDGPSLLEYLDNMKTVNRLINAPFMLPVSGKMKDLGTVVEGKIESGHVRSNQKLIMMPNRTNVEVVTMYNETEAETDVAYCGEQVRIKLKGIEEEDISNGFVLCSPKFPVKTVTKFEAQIAIVELKSILSTGFSCVMHIHTAIEEVTFSALLHKLEKGTNRKSKKPPAFAKKGMKIIAILETADPVCVETYEDYPQLGRFTLRDQGTTIAIGKITKLL
ncbi:hypothetical protein PACTADRAFT_50860 [Pachysolen tannophilus NRRL Y-2460]|uniref:Eukaryotic peptide chain release factor GTP-binding subunit n=1 Tax=Pachysolen tannophilus NRRL Y-2460 TaxID=669874 RepID=A0A1E4TTG7_PACTA|nr:hypothetical protein PACTADRAFT_50860 [Pachysolen tannophilus NRRL Y-2460]